MIKAIENRVEPRLESFQRQALPKGNSAVSFGASEMNKEMSQAQMNNFQATQRINKSKDISFTGDRVKEPPRNWVLSDNRTIYIGSEKTSSEQEEEFAKEKRSKGNSDLIEFAKNNRNVLLQVQEDVTVPTLLFDGSWHQVGIHEERQETGYMYIDENGLFERLSIGDVVKLNEEILDKLLLPENIERTMKDDFVSSRELTEGLIKRGRGEEALKRYISEEYKDFYSGRHDYSAELLVNELIMSGKISDAYRLFPQERGSIWTTLKNLGIDKDGKYFGIDDYKKGAKGSIANGNFEDILRLSSDKWPPSLRDAKKEEIEEALDFINENIDIEKWAEISRKDAEERVRGRRDLDSKVERVIRGVLTLGISEITNAVDKKLKKNLYLANTNGKISEKREMIAKVLAYQLQIQEECAEIDYKLSLKLRSLEEKKSAAKEVLSNELIFQIDLANRGRPYDLPNCVMLVGENPYVMKELIDWTGQHAAADYVIVPNNLNGNELQKDLVATLKSAEANYQKTGKRTVIYVENMEKLLNPQTNSSVNIAAMKDYMNKAERRYHSTIIFQTKDPDKLDPNTTVSHRVGLKVDVPVSFDDANLLKV